MLNIHYCIFIFFFTYDSGRNTLNILSQAIYFTRVWQLFAQCFTLLITQICLRFLLSAP